MKKKQIPVGMERNIPSMNNSLLFFMDIRNKEYTDKTFVEEYNKQMIKRELSMEKWLLNTFAHLGISASVKSYRYSLPIKYQVKTTQPGESYLNGAFETYEIFREAIKTVVEQKIYKLRFYIFAEVEDSFPMGKVNYYFNYYIKTKN
jgi:hypothetical protein